jgi:hypothetical protein
MGESVPFVSRPRAEGADTRCLRARRSVLERREGRARSRGRPRPCRAAAPGRRACRSGRAGTRAWSPCPRSPGLRVGSVDGATCADRTTVRQAHTRAAAVARHGTDSATIAGTAGAPQRNKNAGPIHGAQDPDLGASVGQTRVRQRESRAWKQGEREPKECGELLHASPELQDSCWSSDALRSVTSRLTTTFGALLSHPRVVERGTRDPRRSSRPRWLGRDPEASGRSAAEGAPWSSWG